MGKRKKGDTLYDIATQISRIVNGEHKVITHIRVASAGAHRRYASSSGCDTTGDDLNVGLKLFGPPSSETIIAGCPSATNTVNVFEAASVHSEIGKLLKMFASRVVDLFVKGPQCVAEFAAEWTDDIMPTVPQKYQYEMQGFAALFSFLFYQVAQAQRKYLDALRRAALPTSVEGIEALIRSLTVMKDALAATASAATDSEERDGTVGASGDAADYNMTSGEYAVRCSVNVDARCESPGVPPRRSPARARPWRDKSVNEAKAGSPGSRHAAAAGTAPPSRLQTVHQEPSVSTFQMHLDLASGANVRQEYDPETAYSAAALRRQSVPHPPPAKRTAIPAAALVQSAEEGVRSGQLPPAALSTGALLQALLVANSVEGPASRSHHVADAAPPLPSVHHLAARKNKAVVPVLRGDGASWAASVTELKPILFSPRLPDEARLRSPLRGEAKLHVGGVLSSTGTLTVPLDSRIEVPSLPTALPLPRAVGRSTLHVPRSEPPLRSIEAVEVLPVGAPQSAASARSWKEFWEAEDRKRLQHQLGVATVTNFRARDLARYGEDMEKLRNEVLGPSTGPSSRGLVLDDVVP